MNNFRKTLDAITNSPETTRKNSLVKAAAERLEVSVQTAPIQPLRLKDYMGLPSLRTPQGPDAPELETDPGHGVP